MNLPKLLIALPLIGICLSCINNSNNNCQAPSGYQEIGIDVSHHQGIINWEKVGKADSIKFVYIKATEGKTYFDPQFKRNMIGAKKNGFLVGAYHFFRMTSSAHEQFVNFKNVTNGYEMDLIPMIDIEVCDGKETRELQDSLDVLIGLLKAEYGALPMIYGTQRSYNTYCAPKYNNHHLYIGRYGKNKPQINGKGTYTIWQYTESAIVNGIPKPVDMCRFNPKYSIKDIILPK